MRSSPFFVLLFFFALTHAFSQTKVVDRSGSKPDWTNGVESGFIIVSARGVTVDNAKNAALNSVKEMIIRSVAENVSASSTLSLSEKRNENSSDISEDYVSRVKTSTPIVPFLKGISISKAVDFYWEKLEESSGGLVFVYHLKYPFSDAEMHDLLSEFNMYQKRYDMELIDIESALSNLHSLTVDSLIFFSGRLSQLQALVSPMQAPLCSSVRDKYLAVIKGLYVSLLEGSNNLITYTLKYGKQTIRCYTKPKISTDCSDAAYFKTDDGAVQQIVLPTFYCKTDKKFTVEVSYLFAGKSLKHVFTLDVLK